MPTIRISDKLYADLKTYAENDGRSVSNAAEFLLSRSGMGRQNNGNYVKIERDMGPIDNIPKKETPTPKILGDKIVSAMPLCKHGAYPAYCKYAKAGKPCKLK